MSDDETIKSEQEKGKTLWKQLQDGTITKKEYTRRINAESYQRNKVQVAARKREWRAANPEANQVIQTRAREKLREKGYFKNWEANNSAKRRGYTANYRQQQGNATPLWLTSKHFVTMQAFYGIAETMTKLTGVQHVVDHIFPLRGKNSCGLHVPWNLQVITQAENDSKGTRTDSLVRRPVLLTTANNLLPMDM